MDENINTVTGKRSKLLESPPEVSLCDFSHDDDSAEEADIKKMVTEQKKKKKKSGGFQSMGFSFPVYKGILKKGYNIPTPIQRKTIPLIMEGKDVVAMARTGSGKTAAFLLPMFERLKTHNAQTGARGLVFSPTRELALQTMNFTKELGRYIGLKTAIILGGDSIEDQFAAVHENPDIIIATPGRFLHVVMEMDLKLSSVEYIVFDEADSLFEMGFQEQLHEVLYRLPDHRQTLLFSATLPRLLVDFAKAGLNEPVLIRLDVDSKLNENLKTLFISCRSDDKLAVLLHLLKYVVKPEELTVVFAATRHHVEYLNMVLIRTGINCTYVYSSLDLVARKINVAKFKANKANVLIVTDIAARGIDIPMLDNVINYNFPGKPKLFVHRVGRVARASRSGTAYSIVTPEEAPYLLDLHLFVGRCLKLAKNHPNETDGIYGSIPQEIIDEETDLLKRWHDSSVDLTNLVNVCKNAYKQYVKSRAAPAVESVKRMKELMNSAIGIHPLFQEKTNHLEEQRENILEGMKKYRPNNTIFEIGRTSKSQARDVMQCKRNYHEKVINKARTKQQFQVTEKEKEIHGSPGVEDDDMQNVFSVIIGSRQKQLEKHQISGNPQKNKKLQKKSFRDDNFYLPYKKADHETEKGLELEKSFDRQAVGAVLDLVGDEDNFMKHKKGITKWDRRKKKFVKDMGIDPRKKKIKTESGVWIPASYKSTIYKQWKEKYKIDKQGNDNEETDPTPKLHTPVGKGKFTKSSRPHKLGQGRSNYKRELKRPEEILKARQKKARMQFHQRRRQAERSKKKGKNKRR
ncbi:ATP-dependent RNA helicase DDX54 [Tachypleus tridentatus]|uniref:ATP-dependent RNA helicase DDX54 n=1 Tax=Tachypleus tridentatus TaxID=6853 RepID=UPI003FD66DE4